MLLSDKLNLRLSEIREALNVLLQTENRTDEQKAEMSALSAEALEKEPEYRAAKIADGVLTETNTSTADPEVRERLELRGRARFGRFLSAAISGRVLDGCEAEYRSAMGTGDGVPMDLFEQDRPSKLEYRADAATTVPATAQGENVAVLQPFVFSESIASRLGIEMPMVGSGAHTEPRISVALTAAAKAKGVAQGSTAATIVGVTAKPRRIAARLTVGIEDVASFGNDSFESSLKENARAVLSDAYDTQAINGNGTAPNVEGLIDQLTNPTNPAAVPAFDDFVESFVDAIDGLWATTPREINIVANVDAFKLSAKTFRDGTGGQSRAGIVAFSDYAKANYGAWFTNKRMPATASTIARGIVYRSGRPGLRTAVHPTWGQITVDDIYSDADSGERHFTLSVLVGDKVLLVQPDAYDLVEYKVS